MKSKKAKEVEQERDIELDIVADSDTTKVVKLQGKKKFSFKNLFKRKSKAKVQEPEEEQKESVIIEEINDGESGFFKFDFPDIEILKRPRHQR